MNFGQPQLIDGKLPVFVFPTSLTFLSDDQSTHKQVLTLYNPYEFNLKFKVLSTVPKKYNVVDSEGIIRSRCCVDIVVRHKDICINNEGVQDKFRIQVTEHGQKKVIGKKDITAVLLPTRDRGQAADEKFETLPATAATKDTQKQSPLEPKQAKGGHGPSAIVIMVAALSIVALMLPTSDDAERRETTLPLYLHLSVAQKLIAAYVLGLVTMAILRS